MSSDPQEYRHNPYLVISLQKRVSAPLPPSLLCANIHEIIFEEFQRMWSHSTNVTDGQTDGRTTYHFDTALCYALHGNNSWARLRGAQLSAGYTVNTYSISRCALWRRSIYIALSWRQIDCPSATRCERSTKPDVSHPLAGCGHTRTDTRHTRLTTSQTHSTQLKTGKTVSLLHGVLVKNSEGRVHSWKNWGSRPRVSAPLHPCS